MIENYMYKDKNEQNLELQELKKYLKQNIYFKIQINDGSTLMQYYQHFVLKLVNFLILISTFFVLL